jgi:hypothetical protein
MTPASHREYTPPHEGTQARRMASPEAKEAQMAHTRGKQLRAIGIVVVSLICGVLAFVQVSQAQGRGERAEAAGGRGGALRASTAPLAFKVDWVRPSNQTGQTAVVQANVADPNVEVKWYGPGAKKLLTSGNPGSPTTPFGVWSGECDGPFVITFRQKTNNIDLSGLSRIRWSTKTSGFHVVRPVVKLTNGTMLVADYAEMHVPMVTQTEFSLAGLRWLRLDPERAVTIAPGDANPPGTVLAPNETWVVNPDLSKVEEFGFADLMPASGHGTGGYIQVNDLEVYGKPVPR